MVGEAKLELILSSLNVFNWKIISSFSFAFLLIMNAPGTCLRYELNVCAWIYEPICHDRLHSLCWHVTWKFLLPSNDLDENFPSNGIIAREWVARRRVGGEYHNMEPCEILWNLRHLFESSFVIWYRAGGVDESIRRQLPLTVFLSLIHSLTKLFKV